MATPASLRNAVVLGLGSGAFFGALYLLWQAMKSQWVDCAGLSNEECVLAQSTAIELARRQLLLAIGLAFGAAACFLLLRGWRKRAAA